MTFTRLETKYDPDSFLAYFRFDEEPFNLAPDPHFLYLSPRHADALAEIDQGISERSGLITLIGEAGTGKTTLARAVLGQWRTQRRVAYVGSGAFTPDDILHRAMVDFGLDDSGGPADWDSRFERLLYDAREDGQIVVLILDEAHNLPDDTVDALNRILNSDSDEPPLAQVLLVGPPELQSSIERWQERHAMLSVGTRASLGRLSRDESVTYIQHRLEVAGGIPEVFPPATTRMIVRAAQGLPQQLNVLCQKALTVAYQSGRQRVDVETARRALRHHVRPRQQRRRRQVLRAASAVLPVVVLSALAVGLYLRDRARNTAGEGAPETLVADVESSQENTAAVSRDRTDQQAPDQTASQEPLQTTESIRERSHVESDEPMPPPVAPTTTGVLETESIEGREPVAPSPAVRARPTQEQPRQEQPGQEQPTQEQPGQAQPRREETSRERLAKAQPAQAPRGEEGSRVETAPSPDRLVANVERQEPVQQAAQPDPAPPPAPEQNRILRSGVSATSSAVARSIVDRSPEAVGTEFPADVGRLFFWTQLETPRPTRVEHVWYFEDREVARIPLELGGSWRVWSSKGIQPDQVGHFRVEVVDARGVVIDQASFETTEPH